MSTFFNRPLNRFLVWLPLWAAVVYAACAVPKPEGGSPLSLHERALAIALTVTCSSTDRGFYEVGGSGVAVSPRHALTARHVIECGEGEPFAVIATDVRGRRFEMAVDAVAPDEADAARLVAVGASEPFAEWAQVGPLPGLDDKACIATGVPHRLWGCGTVSRVGKATFEFWYPGDYGNSGSGVYDSEGRVIGLAVRISPCSNGQFCRTIADARIHELAEGLPDVSWFHTETLELRAREMPKVGRPTPVDVWGI